jgi:hypothetical protein
MHFETAKIRDPLFLTFRSEQGKAEIECQIDDVTISPDDFAARRRFGFVSGPAAHPTGFPILNFPRPT